MKKSLNFECDREFVQRLIAVGHEFDVNKNGSYDSRSGAVNIWASPTDKPTCWTQYIMRGALNYPRSYCGTLSWDWDNEIENAKLYVEAWPYDLDPEKLSNKDMECVLEWVEKKAWELIRFAKIHPKFEGIKCPFCNYVCIGLLNELVEHIGHEHKMNVNALVLGGPTKIMVNGQEYTLEEKTDMN